MKKINLNNLITDLAKQYGLDNIKSLNELSTKAWDLYHQKFEEFKIKESENAKCQIN